MRNQRSSTRRSSPEPGAFARGPFAAALALALVGLIEACGGGPASPPTPIPSLASPSPSSSPTPPAVRAGAPAWVDVSVASGWRSPQSPRPIDAPALANPARVRDWITGMTNQDKTGLIDRLDTQLLLGDEVEVLAVNQGWAQVVVPDQPAPIDVRGYPVWIPVRQLIGAPPPEASESVIVTSPTARLVAGTTVLEVSYGTVLPVVERITGGYRVGLPDGDVMEIAAESVSTQPREPSAAAIVGAARRFIALPYLWGGTAGFGFDCSGLVHLVFKANGVALPRDADPQSRVGTAVERANLLPGDLVFFASGGVAYHVAIYSGGGLVIESPSPGLGVREVALNSLPYIGDYAGARRIVPASAPSSPRPTPSTLPSSLAGAEWTRLPTSEKVVALTFDAGGNNAGVAPIISALQTAGVPATFFLTGRWTEVYPADAKRISAAYGVGNHTYSHPRLTDLTDTQVKDEVTRAEAVIRSTTGRDPHPLFRFPYGSVNSRVLADVHGLGYGGIRWTVDTLGWEGRQAGQSEATVLKRVLDALQPGEIILMHVGAANDGSTLDAGALPAVIEDLRARGYRFVLISGYVT